MKHNSGLFWLSLIFAAAALARLLLTDTSYFFWDESIYLMHGRLFAGQAAAYSETFLRPPLLPLAISPLAHLSSGQYELASRLLVAFLNSLVVLPMFFLTKALFGRKSTTQPQQAGGYDNRWVVGSSMGYNFAPEGRGMDPLKISTRPRLKAQRTVII